VSGEAAPETGKHVEEISGKGRKVLGFNRNPGVSPWPPEGGQKRSVWAKISRPPPGGL